MHNTVLFVEDMIIQGVPTKAVPLVRVPRAAGVKSGRVDLPPLDETSLDCWTVDVDQVAEWWSHLPYGAPVVYGEGVDALEVPSRYGALR